MYSAQISVPYFKQGDDFDHSLRNSSSTKEALESWAADLEYAAKNIRRVAELISDLPNVNGQGGTHYAGLDNLPKETLDKLLEEKLVIFDPYEDEELLEEPLEDENYRDAIGDEDDE